MYLKGVLNKHEVEEADLKGIKTVRAGFAYIINYVDVEIKSQLLYF